jgi:hypothetical protein
MEVINKLWNQTSDEIHFSYDESGGVIIIGTVALDTYIVPNKPMYLSELPSNERDSLSQVIACNNIKYDERNSDCLIQFRHVSHCIDDICEHGLVMETDHAMLMMDVDYCMFKYMPSVLFENHDTGDMVLMQYRKKDCKVVFRDGDPGKGKFRRANAMVDLTISMCLAQGEYWGRVFGSFKQCFQELVNALAKN